ncbi:MAG TPA: tetratricopeptide repeat protein [Candidatus Angelobacter sp.]|nr:tetratricopeptide repeat protein [Candidatus Angelobacter sp.]
MHPRAPYFFLVVAALLFVLPGTAQKKGHNNGMHPTSPPAGILINNNPRSTEGAFDTYPITEPEIERKLSTTEQPPCFQWPMAPVLSSTVSASRMTVPDKAKKEFGEACLAVRKKKLKEAQHHLDRALGSYSKFADAWVLLGQTQENQGELQQAEQSCEQARAADSSYLPGYLCLAHLAARQEKWDSVAQLTDQVIAMHPTRAPGAFFFNFLGHFYLKQWDLAEKSALAAFKDGSQEQSRQVRWMLAKMYELKGDRSAEAEQLSEYVKLYPNDANASVARQVLAQIQAQQPSVQSPPR